MPKSTAPQVIFNEPQIRSSTQHLIAIVFLIVGTTFPQALLIEICYCGFETCSRGPATLSRSTEISSMRFASFQTLTFSTRVNIVMFREKF